MERVIPAGMQESLERNRSKLNSIFEYRMSVNREPDYDDILLLFFRMISPVYDKGLTFTDEQLCSIFSMTLNLTCKGYIGRNGRFKDVEEKFFLMLHSFPSLFASEKKFPIALFNALLNLYSNNLKVMDAWCDRIKLLDCADDFELFRRKGYILAWRYGIARYRSEAVAMLDSLTGDDLKKIFELPASAGSSSEQIISYLKNDPWYNPGEVKNETLPVFLYADGFSGFGGHFKSVPDVFSFDGELFAADEIDVYRIYADTFGVELVHEPALKPDKLSGNGAGMVYGITGTIVLGGKSYHLPDFSSGVLRSSASEGHTSAWTVQNSYKIFIAGISTGNG